MRRRRPVRASLAYVTNTPTITVAAICIRDASDRLLTVRKRGTAKFMLPGGKLEPGETPAHAVVRETAEETGITVDLSQLVRLGHWRAPAANERGTSIESTVYIADVDRPEPEVAREIAQLRWLDLSHTDEFDDLAPMLTLHVIPALVSRDPATNWV